MMGRTWDGKETRKFTKTCKKKCGEKRNRETKGRNKQNSKIMESKQKDRERKKLDRYIY